ncbi:extracellular alkaline serine protease [Colletotrichum costaricense]|uniref:Extracellular alkaline serine protease n=1 Tax=Colletotrichum costaricense TaxID=1209916 RepID=A0AAJ0E296_9PEZI|nr:extracellular alkaline serine protease [Colletotrichum costaricense]KAK1528645.1 extracellular alkaline serine protease [Colletotrichum costaricense]
MSWLEKSVSGLLGSIKGHVEKIVADVPETDQSPEHLKSRNDAELLMADFDMLQLWEYLPEVLENPHSLDSSDNISDLKEWEILAAELDQQGRWNEIDFGKCSAICHATMGGDISFETKTPFERRIFPTGPSTYLFDVLVRQSSCCRKHIARLHLNGFYVENADAASRFSLFVSCNSGLDMEWHEASYDLLIQDTGVEASPYPDDFCTLPSLCDQYGYVNIRQAPNRKPIVLAKEKKSKRRLDTPTQCLGKLLDQGWIGKNGHCTIDGGLLPVERAALSLNLARALVHLSPDAWVRNEWSLDNIFLSWSPGTPDGSSPPTIDAERPYLSIRLDNEKEMPSSDKESKASTFETILLSFAQVLMEISTGKRLLEDPQPGSNKRGRLTNWFKSRDFQWSLLGYVKDAINSCLEAAYVEGKVGMSINEWIYDNIISQLEENWQQYKILDPPSFREWDMNFLTPLTSQAPSRSEGVSNEQNPSTVQYFNGRVSGRHGENSSSLWFRKMNDVYSILGPGEQSDTQTRVAVLDTGITQEEAKLNGIQAHSYRDFTGAEEVQMKDQTGHGSDIVKLIYRMCNSTDVLVARVWENDYETEGTASAVVQAVSWAIEKNAEVICMAFGFITKVPDLEKAFREAIPKGILVFAAASNTGNSARITYPASWDSHVFCTFSTNGNIKNSHHLNPTGQDQNNFAILGEDLQLSDDTKNSKIVSGTSYSTALACGLASLLLNFSKQVRDPESNREQIADVLKYKDNLTKVLCKISELDGHYKCIVPWKLLPKNLQGLLPLEEGSGLDKSIRVMIRTTVRDKLIKTLGLADEIWLD